MMCNAACIDDADLAVAARDLAEVRAELREAHQIAETRTRREALKATAAKLALIARMVADVAERRKEGFQR